MKKRKLYICIAFIVVIFVILWSSLSLTKLKDRSNPYTLDRELKSQVDEETKGMSAEQIRKYSVRKTASLLSFTEKNDLANHKANCVGYARMCARISNEAFRKNGLDCSAKPVVGYVMLFDINICGVMKSIVPKRWKNFVKDHDFVEYTISGTPTYADACAYDLLFNDCLTSPISH